jgi:hypothetical protein
MSDVISELLKEQKQTNQYLKQISVKVHSIESELVSARLKREAVKHE